MQIVQRTLRVNLLQLQFSMVNCPTSSSPSALTRRTSSLAGMLGADPPSKDGSSRCSQPGRA